MGPLAAWRALRNTLRDTALGSALWEAADTPVSMTFDIPAGADSLTAGLSPGNYRGLLHWFVLSEPDKRLLVTHWRSSSSAAQSRDRLRTLLSSSGGVEPIPIVDVSPVRRPAWPVTAWGNLERAAAIVGVTVTLSTATVFLFWSPAVSIHATGEGVVNTVTGRPVTVPVVFTNDSDYGRARVEIRLARGMNATPTVLDLRPRQSGTVDFRFEPAVAPWVTASIASGIWRPAVTITERVERREWGPSETQPPRFDGRDGSAIRLKGQLRVGVAAPGLQCIASLARTPGAMFEGVSPAIEIVDRPVILDSGNELSGIAWRLGPVAAFSETDVTFFLSATGPERDWSSLAPQVKWECAP